ncbi:MAG: metallophosphoesterase [Myxococcales bacterium]|nr:metallophosphoesterase [Myxococcales bacterium]
MSNVPRVVAVGDLHGDHDNALAVLRLAGVVDEAGRWSGGDTVLVQTGDVTDRGPDSRRVMALLRGLQGQAIEAGGRVEVLLGNHEAMNLQGDWRYVHPDDVADYGGVPQRRAALAATGPDGTWLRGLDAVTRVQGVAFAHGGITEEAAAVGVEGLNRLVRAALAEPQPVGVLGPEGPLWYRGYVQEPETVACPRLRRALEQLDSQRMVVGHTTRRDGRIQTRCDGALTVIDIGIAEHYGGNLGAWELRGGDARALYPSGPVDLADPPTSGPAE